MSTRQQDEGPRDWRRRRRRRPLQEQSAQAAPEESGDHSADEPEEQTSRTLISFLDPAVDVVGIFGAPLLVAGIIGLVTGIVVVAFVSSMRLYGWIDIAIGASLIGLVGAVFISTVIAAFLSRTGRYGINTLILLAAFIGIVIVINVVSFENKQRSDVTATNQFSLSERTKELLEGLEDDIQATAFYKALEETPDANVAARRNRVVDTLDEFSARSGKFTYRVVDPDLEPSIVAAYFGARPTGFVSETVVIENLTTGEFDSLQPTDIAFGQLEQDLVTSLYVATGLEQKTVYFLGGHGERNLDSGGGDGYALLRQALEQENYLAQGLVWPRNSTDVEVPEDAALVVVAGPTSDLPVDHALALDLYLLGRDAEGQRRRENGSMIFLAEPDTPDSWREFLIQWGIILLPGYIRDIESSVPGLPQTLALNMDFNTIVNFNLLVLGNNEAAMQSAFEAAFEIVAPEGQQLQDIFMPDAAALSPLPVTDGARLPLALSVTSPNSYIIGDPDRTDPVTEGENADVPGPFIPAMLMRSAAKVGMALPEEGPVESDISLIMAFGDADFVANSNIGRGSGLDMFVNSTNYLLGDYSLVSIRPKALAFREFNLDRNEYNFVRFSSWLFLPGLMALAAGLVWWLRR
ncbi:MAG: hypothetical protein F4X66_05365 [Chloroflexi bacterium]|nr:hypothetical protein [Chloroflexota bacterium]MYE39606.1 hypothetical protein [Chloroflexota bacterium]